MAVGRPTFLSRLFEFPIRAACTEVAPLKWISIREQWLVHRSRFPKDDWHFSWCWPWVPLSIFVPPAAVLVRLRSRTGHERWYLERNISRVPTTFSKNKIAGIEERPRDKKPACRCKFHANLGFPWIPQLSPPWDPKNRAQTAGHNSGIHAAHPSFMKSDIHLLSVIYSARSEAYSYAINKWIMRDCDRLFFTLYG